MSHPVDSVPNEEATASGALSEDALRAALDVPAGNDLTDELNYPDTDSNGIYDFEVLDCYRELYDLYQHRGYPLIICNVASKCKYSETGYKNLCTLFERYSDQGFTVLAFPCNQFGNGEPYNADELEKEIPKLYPSIKAIDFPIMCKVDVNGDRELMLYGYLKSCLKGSVGQTAINWNFTYFVINRDGIPISRFGPEAKLEELDAQVRQLLEEAPTTEPS